MLAAALEAGPHTLQAFCMPIRLAAAAVGRGTLRCTVALTAADAAHRLASLCRDVQGAILIVLVSRAHAQHTTAAAAPAAAAALCVCTCSAAAAPADNADNWGAAAAAGTASRHTGYGAAAAANGLAAGTASRYTVDGAAAAAAGSLAAAFSRGLGNSSSNSRSLCCWSSRCSSRSSSSLPSLQVQPHSSSSSRRWCLQSHCRPSPTCCRSAAAAPAVLQAPSSSTPTRTHTCMQQQQQRRAACVRGMAALCARHRWR